MQVFGVWLFLYAALRFLDVRVQRRKTAAEREAEALQERVDELSRSNADLEQFAHVVAHDLRSPLQNLIANALKFSRDGAPRVELSARQDGAMWEVAVCDNGPGIAPADATRIFEMFERGEHADGGGTGLGLAMAQKIVERHGGRIWVEPAPGGGSRFAFTLPATAPQPEAVPLVPAT